MDGDSPIPILASAVFADARGALPFYIILFALCIFEVFDSTFFFKLSP